MVPYKRANDEIPQKLLRRYRRTGLSLLEVMAALMLLGLFLAPSAQWMAGVAKQTRVIRNRGELVNLVRGQQNELCQWVRSDFRETKIRGNFSGQGHPDLLFEGYCSQDSASGGMPGLLMSVRTMGWHDSNSNGLWDTGETHVDLWTAVARATP